MIMIKAAGRVRRPIVINKAPGSLEPQFGKIACKARVVVCSYFDPPVLEDRQASGHPD